jgi:hypothetical protein
MVDAHLHEWRTQADGAERADRHSHVVLLGVTRRDDGDAGSEASEDAAE